jgi:hypothetical protein
VPFATGVEEARQISGRPGFNPRYPLTLDYCAQKGGRFIATDEMSAMAPAREKTSGVATVPRVTSGTFLEMFDFFLFGFYVTYISKAFFPNSPA